jgi:hypothetical protein
MYLSTLMLTGQGGPEGELPWYTKGVVLLTGLFSIGMFAIPASMLTWGFEAEAHRLAKRSYQLTRISSQQQQQQDTTAGQYHDSSDSWSSADDDYSTDEEYVKIISGEGENEEEDEDNTGKAIMDEATKAAIAKFLEVDEDGSGSISLEEFLHYVRESTLIASQERPGGGVVPRYDLKTKVKAASTKGLAAAGSDTQELQKRIVALEAKLDDVLVKVDRLCHLLESQGN